MPGPESSFASPLPVEARQRHRSICDSYRQAWHSGLKPRMEAFLGRVDDFERPFLFRRLLLTEIELRCRQGDRPAQGEYLDRFPKEQESIYLVFAEMDATPLDSNPRTPLPESVGSTRRDARDPQLTYPWKSDSWNNGNGTESNGSNGDSWFLGDYEVLGLIGKGGMGVVYRARQRSANRVVALKVIKPELEECSTTSKQAVERFLIEAQAAAGLVHDHLVPIYEVGQHEGRLYYSMRLIEGRSLAELLDDGPLDNRRAAEMMEPIARAVHHAHEQHIVHRDIKPRNILVEPGDRPYVMDFGLAKRLEHASGLTVAENWIGTPAYMSPEQARDATAVSPRSDVYSLGATFYQMLTGRPPFQAADAIETMRQVRDEEPAPLRQVNPSIHRDLETICLKCLRKDPGHRYASANDLAQDLSRYLSGQPIKARPVRTTERVVKWACRNPAAATLVTLAILAFPGILVAERMLDRRTRRLEAAGLLRQYWDMDISRVQDTAIVLRPHREQFEPELRAILADPGSPASQRMRTALLLLESDPGMKTRLHDYIWQAGPQEIAVVRLALAPHASEYAKGWWEQVEHAETRGPDRLRAACLLASWESTDPRWSSVHAGIVARLVAENPFEVRHWADLLRPLRLALKPGLERDFRDTRAREKSHVAAAILADYFADDPVSLVEWLVDADPPQFAVLLPKVQILGGKTMPLLRRELLKGLTEKSTEEEKDQLYRRQANAAVALLQMGQGQEVWPLMTRQAIVPLKIHVLHRLAEMGVDPAGLLAKLGEPSEDEVRRTLILSMGEYPAEQLPPSVLAVAVDRLSRLYCDDPDSGIHSACGWCLRRWGKKQELADLDGKLRSRGCSGASRWYVSEHEAHGLAIIPSPVGFYFGQSFNTARPASNRPEKRQLKPFAIGMTEVTLSQFRRFRPNHAQDLVLGPTPDCPVNSISLQSAAEYCNWLSDREGIPPAEWCYVPGSGSQNASLVLRDDFHRRRGFRLPTEAEWEYVSLTEAEAVPLYGQSAELMSSFVWYERNCDRRTWPVGLLKPNPFGLFDTLGNITEMCSCEKFIVDETSVFHCAKGPGLTHNIGSLRNSARMFAVDPAGRPVLDPKRTSSTAGFRIAKSILATDLHQGTHQ